MNEKLELERIKQDVGRIHDDVYRLAKALRLMLVRKYKDVEERQAVAAKIMKEIQAQV